MQMIKETHKHAKKRMLIDVLHFTRSKMQKINDIDVINGNETKCSIRFINFSFPTYLNKFIEKSFMINIKKIKKKYCRIK